jgi:hypothetical protein
MKRGPKLATKFYLKPAHTALQVQPSHHMKRGVVHNLISRAKVKRQDQKDFSKETKNIKTRSDT